jgi:hypothetical protein
MKTINFRGGVMEFRIPAIWKEEFSEKGGVFYEDRPNSGIFRVMLTTLQAAPGRQPSTVEILNPLPHVNGTAEALPNGNAIATTEETAMDRDDVIKVYSWFLANCVPPHHIRIAIFSYAILRNEDDLPKTRCELIMLDTEIRLAAFSPDLARRLR